MPCMGSLFVIVPRDLWDATNDEAINNLESADLLVYIYKFLNITVR